MTTIPVCHKTIVPVRHKTIVQVFHKTTRVFHKPTVQIILRPIGPSLTTKRHPSRKRVPAPVQVLYTTTVYVPHMIWAQVRHQTRVLATMLPTQIRGVMTVPAAQMAMEMGVPIPTNSSEPVIPSGRVGPPADRLTTHNVCSAPSPSRT